MTEVSGNWTIMIILFNRFKPEHKLIWNWNWSDNVLIFHSTEHSYSQILTDKLSLAKVQAEDKKCFMSTRLETQ